MSTTTYLSAAETANEAEEWRPIPSFPGYEASSLGRVRSVDRILRQPNRWGQMIERHMKGRILRLFPRKSVCGVYYTFSATRRHCGQVNRVVCEAFHGIPPSPEHEAAHLDGNPSNNRPGNLVWATGAENSAHKIAHGTHIEGSRQWRARLHESSVQEMFRCYAEGEPGPSLAARFGVTTSVVRNILRRGSWKHVPIEATTIAAVRAKAAENQIASRKKRSAEDARLPLAQIEG